MLLEENNMRLKNAGNVAGKSAFCCAFGLMPLMVAAQTDVYPAKAVRVVIPFSPGTPIELPPRDRLEAAWPALVPTPAGTTQATP